MAAKDRPATQLAAKILGQANVDALNEGKCPMCLGEIIEFRNNSSRTEFQISGMCQKCQDDVFGVD